MDAGARASGASRRGRDGARVGGAVGRDGRAAGRGGRSQGRGLPAELRESAAPSVATASVTQSVSLAGEAGLGVGSDAGVGAALGEGAAPAQGHSDQIVGLLTQLLARFPPAVSGQAPSAPPVAGAQQGAAFVGQQEAVIGESPSYLEMRGHMQRFASRFSKAELLRMAVSIGEDQRERVDPVVFPSVVAPFVQRSHQQKPQRHQSQQSRGSGSGKGGQPTQGQKRRLDEPFGGNKKVRNSCFGCGSMEHRVADCPRREADPEARVCFYCRESGHIRQMCPKLQPLAMVEFQPVVAQPESQSAAVQPLGRNGVARREFSPEEVGQTSQSGQITGKILDPDFVNS